MHQKLVSAVMLGSCLALSGPTAAQSQQSALTLEAATRIADAAQAEATRNKWNVVIAVVDVGGYLIHLRRLDNTQLGSVAVAEEKAKSAALFRRPTKAFADAVASGRTGVLRLPGAIPIEGGVPLLAGDQVVGAIGVSGVTAEQDGQVAQAGAKAFTKP
ncbi:MAG TPA: heme-binding protein [Gemmatimonadales bacterium]|nr:heme-binding protein [Gemmatimonadales bacterium]